MGQYSFRDWSLLLEAVQVVVENVNSETSMNGSAGTIRIFLNDDTVYEAPCSELEYVTAMKNLGAVEREVYVNNILRGFYLTTELYAPTGMIALEFNNKNNIISVYHADIKRIYWESNI